MKKILALILSVLMLSTLLCSCSLFADNTPFTRGETTATSYTNESVGITFNLPKGWRFYTESEIASLMNISVDLFKDKDLFASEDLTSMIDFMALDPLTNNNVNMSVENLKTSGNANITVSKYIESFKNLIKQQITGATYTFSDESDVKLGNTDFVKITANCNYGGTEMTQYIYFIKVGSYMVSITATASNGMDAATFEAMFS